MASVRTGALFVRVLGVALSLLVVAGGVPLGKPSSARAENPGIAPSVPLALATATSVVLQLDDRHSLAVRASVGMGAARQREREAFAGVQDVVTTYDLVSGGRVLGTLRLTVRRLPEGNVAVFSRLDAADKEVSVDLELRAGGDSCSLLKFDPEVRPEPQYGPHFGYDRVTNPVGIVEVRNGGSPTSAVLVSKAYEFRELVSTYSGGRASVVKELVEEREEMSLSGSGSPASISLDLSARESSCERFFVVSPRPLVDADLPARQLSLVRGKTWAWADHTGPYMKGPWSIEPFTREGYVRAQSTMRNPRMMRSACATGSLFLRDLTYSNLYSLWLIRGGDGLWRTEWTSTWVKNGTGIVAPFVDTRHNETIGMWILEFAGTMGASDSLVSALERATRPFAEYLVEKAKEDRVMRTATGYLLHDYYDDVTGRNHSHVSLNHALGEMNYLLELYARFFEPRYLSTALAVRNAVRDTGDAWIAPSGDLWYGIGADGSYFGMDYQTVTLYDLILGQELLEESVGEREPAFDRLIASKQAFLRASGGPDGIGQNGGSHFETAAMASRTAHPDGSDSVIIATARSWPDALGASSLAAALDAPLLLVARSSVPAVIREEITRLGATNAVIVGGDLAVSWAVEQRLEAVGLRLERLAGADRYATADAVARMTIDQLGEDFDGHALVVSGQNFPDAIAAAPLAAARGWPFFLARPDTGLSAETEAAMDGVAEVVVVGGVAAVSDETIGQLKDRFGNAQVERLSGEDRYATAARVATHAAEREGLAWDRVGIASGERFADALVGGVLQGKIGSVLLLTRQSRLVDPTRDVLSAHKSSIDAVSIFGDDLVVGPAVRAAIARVLE